MYYTNRKKKLAISENRDQFEEEGIPFSASTWLTNLPVYSIL